MTFTEKCYKLLKTVPKGRVTTYKDLANALGCNAVRAVGTAMRKNPYAPEVPCHRVVYSDGRVGPYSANGGIPQKISFLAQEGVEVKDGYVQDFKEKRWKF
jgi:methylated-DNA-[protein]-cysteine S-methyltransferase